MTVHVRKATKTYIESDFLIKSLGEWDICDFHTLFDASDVGIGGCIEIRQKTTRRSVSEVCLVAVQKMRVRNVQHNDRDSLRLWTELSLVTFQIKSMKKSKLFHITKPVLGFYKFLSANIFDDF